MTERLPDRLTHEKSERRADMARGPKPLLPRVALRVRKVRRGGDYGPTHSGRIWYLFGLPVWRRWRKL